MIEGVLFVNLDPPYIGFTTPGLTNWRHTSKDELQLFLVEVDVLKAESSMPREYQVRVPGQFPLEKLTKFGLVNQVARSH